MRGITFGEFYDKLYYGTDIDFCYQAIFYHICSGYEEGVHGITIYEYDNIPGEKSSYYREIYNETNSSPSENIDNFINSAIFDGKNLQQIDADIEVLYS